MDSLAKADDDLNKSFKFSLHTPAEFYTNARHLHHQHHQHSSSSASIDIIANFKFQRYRSRKHCSWKKISEKFKHFMFALLRSLFYVFLLLSLSDCWFQVGSAALIIGEDKSTPPDRQFLNRTSSSILQLPIQALIFEADITDTASAGRHTEPLSNHHSTTTTSTTSWKAKQQQTNDGNNVALSSTSHSLLGNTHHSNSNNNNRHSIRSMFTTAGEAATSTTAASLSNNPAYGHRQHNGVIINTITSTLSSLSTTTNDTEWPLSSSSTLTSSLSSSLSLSSSTSSSSSFSSSSPSTSSSTPVEFTMPAVHTVLVSIVLLFVILGTIVGNVLVCIAVCMVRKLRRPCNYLLVSLALSDLCVAVLVMPMALLYEVLEKWNFGPLLCDIWVSFDVLCCTASILNLCAISVDRYLAITKPLEYGVKRTPRRMMLCVALVWLAAGCISLPPLLILGNEHEDEHGNPMCSVCQNFAYQIYATLGSFYIPLAVMLFVYYQIFRAARRIVLEEKRAQTHLQHALNGTGSPPGHTDLDGNGQTHRHSSYGNTSLNYSTCGNLSTSHHSGGGGAGGHGGGSGSSGLLGSPHQKKLRFQLAKEKKASTTLGIIMSAFTICWLPFFILALIRPFVESETTHVPQSLSSLFLWLGYANSLLNPIIYATLNRDFRKPFQEILYFRCSSLNTMMRENYYQDQYGEPPSQRVMLGDERHGARESFL